MNFLSIMELPDFAAAIPRANQKANVWYSVVEHHSLIDQHAQPHYEDNNCKFLGCSEFLPIPKDGKEKTIES